MSRNPIARAVRRIPSQVVPDRRSELIEEAERREAEDMGVRAGSSGVPSPGGDPLRGPYDP